MTETDLPSNWGRWGDRDQLGTLNLIDDAARARAAAEVRSGRSMSLARPVAPVSLSAGVGPVGTPALMPTAVLQTMNFGGTRPYATTDTLVLNVHNAAMTHLDALAHMPVDAQVYPGVPLDEAVTPRGVQHGSTDSFATGVVTRGVLLDLAPHGARLEADRRIAASDLDHALEAAGVTLVDGDAIAVRGGWDTNLPLDQPVPGLDLTAVDWLNTHGVSVYLGDIGDPRPSRCRFRSTRSPSPASAFHSSTRPRSTTSPTPAASSEGRRSCWSSRRHRSPAPLGYPSIPSPSFDKPPKGIFKIRHAADPWRQGRDLAQERCGRRLVLFGRHPLVEL